MGNVNFDVNILKELGNEVSTLFAFFKRVGAALSITVQYIDSLPDYLKATCLLIIGIGLIYFVTGR